jgi:LPS export ABC transporter protein LptC
MSNSRLSGIENNLINMDGRVYSRFVKFIRIFLPLLVVAILGIVFLWPQLKKIETTPLTQTDIEALKQAESQNSLLAPVFNTNDSKGNPVTISASEAKQDRQQSEIITLINPKAAFENSGNEIDLQAKNGVYHQSEQTIMLRENVIIQDKDGIILETESLDANISLNTAKSQTPAKLTTKNGVIEGQSVEYDNQKQTTTFQGPAKAVINQ